MSDLDDSESMFMFTFGNDNHRLTRRVKPCGGMLASLSCCCFGSAAFKQESTFCVSSSPDLCLSLSLWQASAWSTSTCVPFDLRIQQLEDRSQARKWARIPALFGGLRSRGLSNSSAKTSSSSAVSRCWARAEPVVNIDICVLGFVF